MKGFRKNNRGAVTVMVTLLLIPALLFSGSGVDIARIYTAKSIMQNANQMGANAALTQYDAMLQDIYGLFALSAEDAELNQMVTDYVNLSLYGTKDPASAVTKEGSLRLFSGSVSKCTVESLQSLGEINNLRHQIEDYAKFRAPVAIADEIIDRIKSFEKVKANSEAIKDKIAIDSMVSDMQKLCIEVYDAIEAADKILQEQVTLVRELNDLLTEVNRQFNLLVLYRDEYEATIGSGDLFEEEKLRDWEDAYGMVLNNLSKIATASSAPRIKKWISGDVDAEGEWERGTEKNDKELSRSIQTLCEYVKSQSTRDKWRDQMDAMVRKCEQLDSRCQSIKTECDRLEAKLNSGEVDETLAEQLKSQISAYKDLVKIEAKPLAEQVRDHNTEVLDNFVEEVSGVVYGNLQDNVPLAGSYLSMSSLSALDSMRDFAINVVEINKTLQGSQKADEYRLGRMAALKNYTYTLRFDYKLFRNDSVFTRAHREFYEALGRIAQPGNKDKEKGIIDNILEFLKEIKEELQGLYDYKPQGAKYYKNNADDGNNFKQFGMSGSWDSMDNVMDEMDGALDQAMNLTAGLDQLSRKVLLVAYASEMFSCYTDPNTKEEPGAPKRITLSGIPMDTNVNYFYQSELEYLYNGNLGSATKNLLAVSGTIFLIRFVFNYIVSFTISDVKNVVTAIKTALSAIPLVGSAVGIAVSELARVAMALGESVIDLTRLRNGEPVVLIKNDESWRLSISGFLEEVAVRNMEKQNAATKDVERENGLYYIDYLRIFLLLKDGNTMAKRVSDLIELNVTNAKNSVYQKGSEIAGNEGAINGKPYFELDSQAIAVKVSTTVDLRFLFFSMGYFQKGVNGVKPPQSTEITVVDYRGY